MRSLWNMLWTCLCHFLMSDSESPLLMHSFRHNMRNRADIESLLPFDNPKFRLMIKIGRYFLPLFFIIYIQILFFVSYFLLVRPHLMQISTYHLWFLSIIDVIFSITFIVASFSDPGSLQKSLEKYPFDPSFINSLPKCPQCNLPKPARCHHCKTCGRCHLRMDHHCPVLGQCVGLGNYQKFLVMLLWGSILSLYATIFLMSIHTGRNYTVFRYIFSLITFVLFVTTFSFYIHHLYLVSVNITTIEKLQKAPNIYNKGIKNNIKQIFGTNPIWFFVPRKEPFITGFEYVSQYEEWNLSHNHIALNQNDPLQNQIMGNNETMFDPVPESI